MRLEPKENILCMNRTLALNKKNFPVFYVLVCRINNYIYSISYLFNLDRVYLGVEPATGTLLVLSSSHFFPEHLQPDAIRPELVTRLFSSVSLFRDP